MAFLLCDAVTPWTTVTKSAAMPASRPGPGVHGNSPRRTLGARPGVPCPARFTKRPLIMISLAIYTRSDTASPAVFSSSVVSDAPRGQLDFDGVVIYDDLGMARAVQH